MTMRPLVATDLAAVLGLTVALAGCSSSSGGTVQHDGGTLDGAPLPPPPALGAQIDRMGRPLIGTALIGVFASAQDQAAARDAYNRAPDPAAWATTMLRPNLTIADEMVHNLAVFDAWDIGDTKITGAGCGNSLGYLGGASPYSPAAALFSDDEIYVDTSYSSCAFYLALELDFVSPGNAPHATCGGRMPSHDVVDMTYSALAGGRSALDVPSNNYAPKIHDGVAAHGDLLNNNMQPVFPFLGPPHP
jgi:hypothetical protein